MSNADDPKKEGANQIKNPSETEAISEHKVLSNPYYKLLYENEAKYNDQLLETMQWSIGVVSGFILILIGGQIFFSSKISKEEVNLIKSDISERFNSFRHESATQLSLSEKDLSERVIAGNKDWMDIESRDIEEKFESLKDENKITLNAQSIKIDSLDDRIEGEIKYIRKEITELEAHSWRLRGVEANALRSFLNSITITIEQGYEEKYLLDDIKKTLEAMRDIEIKDYKETINVLEKVKESNSGLKNEVRNLCDNLPQFMYVYDPRDSSKLISVPLTEKA